MTTKIRGKKRRDESTQAQQERLRSDPFLLKVCRESIDLVHQCHGSAFTDSPLVKVELGSSGGITKFLDRNFVTSDVRIGLDLDARFSATAMPLRDESVDIFFAQDVLHHLPDLGAFASELRRTLKPDGVAVFREPYWGPIAQVIWRLAHPEMFSRKRVRSIQHFSDPMDGNQALAWTLIRHREPSLQRAFAGLEVVPIKPSLGIAFLLSGGATFTTSVPRSLLLLIHRLESKSRIWLAVFGFAFFFVIRRERDFSEVSYGGQKD